MADFLPLVIESAAAANHSAGTTEIEYPLLVSRQFFGSKRKKAWKIGTGANFRYQYRAGFARRSRPA
jgi:hypothetical protein